MSLQEDNRARSFNKFLIQVKALLLVIDIRPVGILTNFAISLALVLGFTDPTSDFIGNGRLCVGKSLGLVIFGSGEVNTVGTSVALDILNTHGALSCMFMRQVTHASILPRVLATVQEEDIVTADVKALVEFIGLISLRFNFASENALAVVGPVI